MGWPWNRETFQRNPYSCYVWTTGPQRCQSLLLFHAFTGCDVTSFMFEIGKKTAWDAWLSYPYVTDTFIALLEDPETLDLYPGHIEHLERFTVLMYSKKTAIRAQSIKPGNYSSHKVWNPSTPSHQQSMHCLNRQGEPSSSQHLFESNHLSRGQWFLIQVNGGGSGMRDPKYGCPIGPISLMPAMAVLCCYIVGAQ